MKTLISNLIIDNPSMSEFGNPAVDTFNESVGGLLTQLDDAEPSKLNARSASVDAVNSAKMNYADQVIGIARAALDLCEDGGGEYSEVMFDDAATAAGEAMNAAEDAVDQARSNADKGLRLASYSPETGVTPESRNTGRNAERSFEWFVEHCPALVALRRTIAVAKSAIEDVERERSKRANAHQELAAWIDGVFTAN